MQRARDELARTVLLLENRVSELEDELVRTREQSAYAASASPRTPTTSRPPTNDVEALRADIEVLLKELDEARATNADLEDAMLAAQAESVQAAERLQRAEKQLRAKSKNTAVFRRREARSTEEKEEAIEILEARNMELKMARDRLIESLDMQAADIDRLAQENAALADAVAAAQDLGSRWEAQLQEVLAQNRHLKSIIEDSAEWAMTPLPDGGPQSSLEERCRQLESTLMGNQARCAELEGQVQALCAELSRVVNHSAALHRAIHPTLNGVELRLAAMIQNSKCT